MGKIAALTLAVVTSAWFTPVSFLIGTPAVLKALCLYSACARNIAAGEQPSDQFAVMIRMPTEDNRVIPILLVEAPRFLDNHRGATPLLLESHGLAEGWSYSVITEKSGKQLISANYIEGNTVSVEYRVSGKGFEPIRSRVISPGHLFSAMLSSLIMAWSIRTLSIRALRRRSN